MEGYIQRFCTGYRRDWVRGEEGNNTIFSPEYNFHFKEKVLFYNLTNLMKKYQIITLLEKLKLLSWILFLCILVYSFMLFKEESVLRQF